MRQITIHIPEVADLLPHRDLLKGWRTVIVNGAAVLYGAAATVAPEVLLPSPEWVAPSQAAGLFVVALGVVNGCLRAITSTPLGEREEPRLAEALAALEQCNAELLDMSDRARSLYRELHPAAYLSARDAHDRGMPVHSSSHRPEYYRGMSNQGADITVADILDLGDKDTLPSLTAPYRDAAPDKPTFTAPGAAALSMLLGFAASAPLWTMAGFAGWLS